MFDYLRTSIFGQTHHHRPLLPAIVGEGYDVGPGERHGRGESQVQIAMAIVVAHINDVFHRSKGYSVAISPFLFYQSICILLTMQCT